MAIRAPDPVLPAVSEESETIDDQQQNYEKFIDETNDDDDNVHDDMNEDELLADEPEESAAAAPLAPAAANVSETATQPTPTAAGETAAVAQESEEKMETEGGENRGTKRRSDSPTKGNTPKKRQRLPPPNIDDFVNEEDEPELSETSWALSWCKLILF